MKWQNGDYQYNLSREIVGNKTPQDIFLGIWDVKKDLDIETLFEHMPPREIAALSLRLDGKTYKEIGSKLDVTAQTARNILRNCVRRLLDVRARAYIFDNFNYKEDKCKLVSNLSKKIKMDVFCHEVIN